MRNLSDAYIEGIIKKAIRWKIVGVWGGELYAVLEAPKSEREIIVKKAGRPKWAPPKTHPWRRFVIGVKKN